MLFPQAVGYEHLLCYFNFHISDALDQLEEEYQRLTCRRIEEEEKACQLEVSD